MLIFFIIVVVFLIIVNQKDVANFISEHKWPFIFLGIYFFGKLIFGNKDKQLKELVAKNETNAKRQGGFASVQRKDTIYCVESSDAVSNIQDASKSCFHIKTPDERQHGSGFVILTDKGWMVLTNFHVVGKSNYVIIKPDNDYQVYGKVVRRDEKRDIALISFPNKANLRPFKLNVDSESLNVGMSTYAIGSPLDEIYKNSVSRGIISYVKRKINGLEYIQSDVSINPGNSGGPLLLESAEVIGVAESGILEAAGINHFIPIASALDALGIIYSSGATKQKKN